VQEEEALLDRVRASLERASHLASPRRQAVPAGSTAAAEQARRADDELVALRDEIGEARLEDVPALIAQMERLQGVSLRRAEAQGILVNPDAPYFAHLRLREEDDKGRPRERDVFIGRSTFIDAASGVRIVDWRHAPLSQLYYRYSEGSDYQETFGEREAEGEVTVRRTLTIEGGALRRVAAPQGIWTRDAGGWHRADANEPELEGGEGKATRPRGFLGTAPGSAGPQVGQRLDRHLPEIAALIDPRQFEIMTTPESGVVVIQGGAGSGKTTIGLHRMAYLAFAHPRRYRPDRMLVVTFGPGLAAYIAQVLPSLGVEDVKVVTFADWAAKALRLAVPWLEATLVAEPPPLLTRIKSHPALLHALEARARAHRGKRSSRAVVELWGELLTDQTALRQALLADLAPPCTEGELADAHRLMAESVFAVLERGKKPRKAPRTKKLPEDDDIRGDVGIDGVSTDDRKAALDLEDMAMILRTSQIVRGPGKPFDHLFVDEAQDLSPLALAALLGHISGPKGPAPSVTLAGDTSQRLFLDNGFADWRSVLGHLGLAHVAVEPLRVAYRSTRQVLAFAREVMGPLAEADPPLAPRSGAPVEMHRFPAIGAAVAFLAEALRPLFVREPRATVGLLARHSEQVDRYYDGLSRAEIPGLRRVRGQDFSFKPGIELAEIREVKGLEFDYVILLDVNATSFGTDAESRHLLHIGATRAAHQLWLLVTGTPSPLIPEALRRSAA
jgi:DNA helicase-2/ATP-dependent DNA helicase PcrA